MTGQKKKPHCNLPISTFKDHQEFIWMCRAVLTGRGDQSQHILRPEGTLRALEVLAVSECKGQLFIATSPRVRHEPRPWGQELTEGRPRCCKRQVGVSVKSRGEMNRPVQNQSAWNENSPFFLNACYWSSCEQLIHAGFIWSDLPPSNQQPMFFDNSFHSDLKKSSVGTFVTSQL